MSDFSTRALGALPSPPDARDYRPQAISPTAAASLPARIDVGGKQPSVSDQGGEGSCVGQVVAYIETWGGLNLPTPAAPYGRILSARDAYEGARNVEPIAGDGAYPRAALKFAHQKGLCLASTWPYVARQRGEAGPSAAAERPLSRVGSYVSVPPASVLEIRAALGNYKTPMLLVIDVTEGFDNPGPGGVIVRRGASRGAHAIAIIGYDAERRAFRIRNSWGPGWADAGYAWLSEDYPRIEAWAVTLALTDVPPPAPAPRPWWAFFVPWFT